MNPLQLIQNNSQRTRSIQSGDRVYINQNGDFIPVLQTGGNTRANVSVGHQSAAQYSPIYRGWDLVGSTIAGLPFQVRQRTSQGSVPLDDHPLNPIINLQPNQATIKFKFFKSWLTRTQSWGNGFVIIERDQLGRVTGLQLVTKHDIKVVHEDGLLSYVLQDPINGDLVLEPFQVLHLVGLSFDSYLGIDTVHLAKDDIGLGVAAQRTRSNFYGNRATPSGMLTTDQDLKKSQADQYKKNWQAAHGGDNTGGIAVLGGGLKFQTMAENFKNSQDVETRKFQLNEASRWTGVPPHKLFDLDRATFSNIESMNVQYYQDAIRAWVNQLENELTVKLISEREKAQGVFINIDESEILTADLATTKDWVQMNLDRGIMSIDEARQAQKLNRVGGEIGPMRFINGAYVRLEDTAVQGQEPTEMGLNIPTMKPTENGNT